MSIFGDRYKRKEMDKKQRGLTSVVRLVVDGARSNFGDRYKGKR